MYPAKYVRTTQTSEHTVVCKATMLYFSVTFHFVDSVISNGITFHRRIENITVEGDVPTYVKSALSKALLAKDWTLAIGIVERYRECAEAAL